MNQIPCYLSATAVSLDLSEKIELDLVEKHSFRFESVGILLVIIYAVW